MISFHFHEYHKGGWQWWVTAGNNHYLFNGPDAPPARNNGGQRVLSLRNCVNAVRTITKHMRPDSYKLTMTETANGYRKSRGERRYGILIGPVKRRPPLCL